MVVEIKGMYSNEAYIIETDDDESLFRMISLAEGSWIRTKILNAETKPGKRGKICVAGTSFLVSNSYRVGDGMKGLVDSAIFLRKYFSLIKEKAKNQGSFRTYEGDYIIPRQTLTSFELAEFIM